MVLITLDTLRYDSFAGSAGNGTAMPRLERWARSATTFTRFYTSTASTQPSHASMLTGLHPWQHGVSRNGMELAAGHRTVTEELRDAGFATAAVVASFPVSARFGFGRGFERFDDRFVAGEVAGREWLGAARRLAEGGQPRVQAGDPFYSLADHVVARALAELDAATARRQFFWFHFFDPHAPYGNAAGGPTVSPPSVLQLAARGEDPAPALARARRLYDADVAFLDAALARLLERLDRDAPQIATHIVIVGDHGESFGEEGSMAHGRRLIPSQLHVPCVLRSPLLASGVRDDVAGSIDVAPTLLAVAGVEDGLRQARPDPGRDLTLPPRWPARAFGMRRTYEKPYKDRRLDGSVHLIDGFLFYFLDGSGELFRGNAEAVQPAGSAALADGEDRGLRALFGGFEQDLARHQAGGVVDPEVEEKLEALGYVQ